MEKDTKKLMKAQQQTEKLQERQASSLEFLVSLQRKRKQTPLTRHPRSLATLLYLPDRTICCVSVADFSSRKSLRLHRHHRQRHLASPRRESPLRPRKPMTKRQRLKLRQKRLKHRRKSLRGRKRRLAPRCELPMFQNSMVAPRTPR